LKNLRERTQSPYTAEKYVLEDKVIRTKLSYDWKNIYRQLALQDENETEEIDI